MGKKDSASEAAVPAEKPKGGKKGLSDLPAEPPKPNKEEFDAKKKAIDEKIEAYRKELKALTDQISDCQTGKDDFEAQKKECFERLNDTRRQVEELRDRRTMLQEKIRESKQASRQAKMETKDLERDMKEWNEDTLEERIQQIEWKMSTDSMTLTEEKKLMQEIKTLKAKRPEVQKKAKKLAALKAEGDPGAAALEGTSTISDELDEVRGQLDELMKKRDKQKEDIQNLKDERENQTGPIKEFITKRAQVKEELTGQQNEMKKLWDDFKGAQRLHNEWDRKRREARKAKEEEERARNDELWNAQKAKEDLEKTFEKPFYEEVSALEQTILFCKSFLNDEEAEVVDVEAIKKAEAEKLEGFVSGATVMRSKKERDDEMYFDGQKGKKGKKKNNKKAAKGLTHTAATFQMFSELKVPAPMVVDDIPGVLSKLQASLDGYAVKIAEWEKDAEKRKEELKAHEEKIQKLMAEEAAYKESKKAERAAEAAAAAEE